MKKLIYLSFLVFSVLFVFSCKKNSDEKNAQAQGNTSLKISSLGSVTRQNSSTYSISLSYAHMLVKEVEFEPVEGVSDSDIDFKGPFDVDLLAGTSVPSIPLANLTVGKYEEAGMELYDEENKSPSITVRGSYIKAMGDTTIFVFKSMEDFEFEADAEDSTLTYLFEIKNESDTINLLMTVDLNQWFQSVDFSTGVKDTTTNEVIVTNSSNVELFNKIKTNIENEVLIVKEI